MALTSLHSIIKLPFISLCKTANYISSRHFCSFSGLYSQSIIPKYFLPYLRLVWIVFCEILLLLLGDLYK